MPVRQKDGRKTLQINNIQIKIISNKNKKIFSDIENLIV